MRIVKVILLVVAMFGITRGADFTIIQAERHDAPEKCHHNGQDYAVNTSITLDGCRELSCYSFDIPAVPHSGLLILQLVSCPNIAVPGGCMVVRNDTTPYPDCCPTVKC